MWWPSALDLITFMGLGRACYFTMLRATSAYVDYAFNDENSKARLNGLIESTKDEIMKIYVEEKGGNLGN